MALRAPEDNPRSRIRVQDQPGQQIGQPASNFTQPQTQGLGPATQQPQPSNIPTPVTPPEMTREKWRDAWMSKGPMTPQQADEWLRANGATQMAGGEKAGRWRTPYGDELDLQIGRGAALASGGTIMPGWTPAGGGGGAPGGGGPVGGGGGGFGGAVAVSRSTYTPGQLPNTPLQTYNPAQISQFSGPQQGDANRRQQQALLQALQTGSMGPDTVAQMKGSLQDTAAIMARQFGERNAASAAQRNVSGAGLQAGVRDIQDRQMSDVLSGYRDIDINAAQTNFQDRLAASGVLDAALGREAGTATDFYRTGLTGQLAQAGENLTGINSQNDAIRFALDRALAQEGLNLQGAQFGEGQYQFDTGLGENARQFNSQLGESGRQFNYNYGLQAQSQQDQRNLAALRMLGLL